MAHAITNICQGPALRVEHLLTSHAAHAMRFPGRFAAVLAAGFLFKGWPNRSRQGINEVRRHWTQKLTEVLGQSFIVENRTGASGIPGTSAVARAEPDGYTLLLGGGGTMTMNPGLFKSLPYDSLKSFAPVGLAAKSPLVVVVPPSLLPHSTRQPPRPKCGSALRRLVWNLPVGRPNSCAPS
jgi:hypothetical protein